MHGFELLELGGEKSVHSFSQPKASVPANGNKIILEDAS
jgi:hypothetical protein